MSDFVGLSATIFKKVGSLVEEAFEDEEPEPSTIRRVLAVETEEPSIPCREKDVYNFQEDFLRRENRELKAKCEKLAVQLRCKVEPNRATEGSAPTKEFWNSGSSQSKQLQVELDCFQAIASKMQSSHGDRAELIAACQKSMTTIADLNGNITEQEARNTKLIRTNRLIIDQLLNNRAVVVDCQSRCNVLVAEVTQSQRFNSELHGQIAQLTLELCEERKISNNLAVSTKAAEAASADNAATLQNISANYINIANRYCTQRTNYYLLVMLIWCI